MQQYRWITETLPIIFPTLNLEWVWISDNRTDGHLSNTPEVVSGCLILLKLSFLFRLMTGGLSFAFHNTLVLYGCPVVSPKSLQFSDIAR